MTLFNNKNTVMVRDCYLRNNVLIKCTVSSKILTWHYATHFDLKKPHNIKGSINCIDTTGYNHEMVHIKNTYYLKYADSKQFYAVVAPIDDWKHMGKRIFEISKKDDHHFYEKDRQHQNTSRPRTTPCIKNKEN